MRLAEHESEGNNEELIAEIIVDVQDPVAPILEAARLDEGSHDTGCVIARLGKVVYWSATAINQHLLRVGAVKIQLAHAEPPLRVCKSAVVVRILDEWPKTGSGDAVKI